MAKVNVSIENEQDNYHIDVMKVQSGCSEMMECFLKEKEWVEKSALNNYFNEKTEMNFDLLLCDNETIQEINRDYRGKDKPTDVISFALFADSEESRIIIDNQINLGQVVISAEKVDEQKLENNKTFEEEFLFLLSHGILHLLGFDHEDETSYSFMMKMQDKIIEGLE